VPDEEKVSMQEPYAIMLRNIKLLYGNVTLPCCGVAPGDGANPKRNMLLFDGLVRLVASSKLAIADTSTVNGAPGQPEPAATAALADAAEELEAGGATGLLLEASNGAAAEAQPGSGTSAAASGSPASSAATVAAELAWLKTADALREADWDHATAYVSQE
jgi:hypothetical protein